MHVCMLSHFSHVRLCETDGQQPSRLLCPRDSLGKNTVMSCHFFLPIALTMWTFDQCVSPNDSHSLSSSDRNLEALKIHTLGFGHLVYFLPI